MHIELEIKNPNTDKEYFFIGVKKDNEFYYINSKGILSKKSKFGITSKKNSEGVWLSGYERACLIVGKISRNEIEFEE
jgi:hypothetical protein